MEDSRGRYMEDFEKKDAGDLERALVLRIREGDASAWSEFVDTFSQGIYTFVRCQIKDESCVDDIVSETFVGVYRNIERFRMDSSLKTWVYSICMHKIKDARRRFARESQKRLALFFDWELFFHRSRPPEDVVSTQSDFELLMSALEALPEKYRMVLICRYFNELSLKETCALLEITENQLHQRVRVGRKRLRAWMDEQRTMSSTLQHKLSKHTLFSEG
ncbi:MAG: hypothetical protein CL920_19165 [Deltaproteobacteria bacterium]|nr:hypothetical protein [Deltaproteobacteria bacterium]MBU50807.1 hypothetical protein [Deltaproteobacteria bacterium]